MHKVVLPNGLTVIFMPKPGASVVVEVMVRTGSNYELPHERGIAHFLEHILFEGTAKRPTNHEISNEIERIGGDFNAYTTNERTCFYVKVLKKHYPLAVDVLADIIFHPLLKPEHIKKEKNIVLKEIDMVFDEPKYRQWALLQKTLFQKHPCRLPVYGDRKVIKSLTRAKILAFYQKYYRPDNMVLAIVGDLPDWGELIKQHFGLRRENGVHLIVPTEPSETKTRVKTQSAKVVNTYVVMGFKTVPRNHPDAYALEVINGILGRGQSGRMFEEIRGKRGLAYDVGTQNIGEVTFGYFALYATIDKKNIEVVRKVMLEEVQRLKECADKDLQEAKEYIEGDYLLLLEDSQKMADHLLFWEHINDARLINDFVARIKKVTMGDVRRVVDTYFKNYTFVVLKGK